MSECVSSVLSGMVRKFRFCHEEVGCNVVGEFYGIHVMLLCFKRCCVNSWCS